VEREALREMTDEAMAHLAALLPAEMRGAYGGNLPGGTGIDVDSQIATRWLEFLDRRVRDP
jgi:hypothetical protein